MYVTIEKGVKVTQAKDLQQPSRTFKPGLLATPRPPRRRERDAVFAAVGGFGSIALLAILVVFLLGFHASSALAGQARLFNHSFGAAASSVVDPYPVSQSSSVAVDTSAGPSRGDVYVVDAGNHRVEKFDPSGHLILMFGKAVNKTKVEEGKPEAEQNVCLVTETCQPGTAASTPGAFHGGGAIGSELFIAVDSSTGLSHGDVYVAESSIYGGGSMDMVTKFDEGGHVVSSWASAGQLDGAGIPEGPFINLMGIAVDSSGNLWVVDGPGEPDFYYAIRASEFKQDSSLITSWRSVPQNNAENSPEIGLGASVAVDSNDNLYIIEADGSVGEWNSAGSRIGTITSEDVNPDNGEPKNPFGGAFHPFAVAVDPANSDTYIAGPFPAFGEEGTLAIRRFDATSCHPLANERLCRTDETFGSGRLGTQVSGLAVDPTTPLDMVYASHPGGEVFAFGVETVPDVVSVKASSLTDTSARLNGTVNPSGVPLTKCFFEWAEGEKPYENDAPCEAPDAAGVGSGSGPVEVHAQIAGLATGKTYHFRLVASNANTDTAEEPSLGGDLSFGPPLLLSTSARGVSATSATLQAELNANSVETHYHFEYDTTPYAEGEGPHGTSLPTPDASIGSGSVDVSPSAMIQGLTPSTVYYYRVVAHSALGTITGPDHSFTTQPAAFEPGLPDGRVWEMVSPPGKSGATISGIALDGEGALQASADGSALTFFANGPFGQGAPASRSFLPSQFLARRGSAGWSTEDISTSREDVVGVIPGNTSGYEVFSQDLSLGAVQSRGTTLLSPRATAPTPYLRASNGEYQPLVSAEDVPPETVFDGKIAGSGQVEQEPLLEGGSPDLHSVVLSSCFKLTEDSVNTCANGEESLYLWHEGALQLVSVLPNEQPAAAQLGGNYLKRHAVSENGMRLVFSTKHLYLRDVALAETVQLDRPELGALGGEGKPQFEDMSADGSKVFFTDGAPLTVNSDADISHPDLYMCEVVVESKALGCLLKDLSVSIKPGETGDVLNASLGADSSGRYIYFVANGALASGATPGDCSVNSNSTGTGDCGLYLYDTVAGTVKLVTMLSGADYPDWAANTLGIQLAQSSARVSPDGRYLAFMSQRGLTGYDNHDAVSGQPDEEVYLYDRLGNDGEGKLVCASCNPTGARPHGLEAETTFGHQLMLNGAETWSKTWLAATIPGWTPSTLIKSLYQSRYLSDSGRLFFNSVDALVPQDSNGVTDVYEYEPPQGEGQPASNNCTTASSTYSPDSGGCVSLISSGTSGEESGFLDASESGDDVFFLTAAKLSSADADTALDVYDARVGGSEPAPVQPPACEGDACQSPASAPEDPTPGSLTYKGPGNLLAPVLAPVKGKTKPSERAQKLARALKVCARKPKRKRSACEKQARRAYGPVGKAKKSNWRAH